MSVLIEAMTLVVARHALDAAVPGGTAAFLQSAAARPAVRYAIADTHLIAVSTVAPAALDALGNQLAPYGIHRRDGGAAVLVDMEMGPLGLCEWLTVRRHPHGLTIAAHRRTTARAPRLVTPSAWRPTQSWQLARTDLRDSAAAQLLHLGGAHGHAQHLDFRTGAVLTGVMCAMGSIGAFIGGRWASAAVGDGTRDAPTGHASVSMPPVARFNT